MVEIEENPQLLWEKCLGIIRDNISPQQVAASFAFVELHSFEDGKLILNVPSEWVKKLLEDNFLPLMAATFKRVFGSSLKELYYNVSVVKTTRGGLVRERSTDMAPKPMNGEPRTDARTSPDDVTAPQVQDLDSQLYPHYKFSNYSSDCSSGSSISGDKNRIQYKIGYCSCYLGIENIFLFA